MERFFKNIYMVGVESPHREISYWYIWKMTLFCIHHKKFKFRGGGIRGLRGRNRNAVRLSQQGKDKKLFIVFHDSGTLKFKNFLRLWVCHTPQFSPTYVMQPRILQCMSHNPVFSDICHSAQNTPTYVTPPNFLWCLSHSPEYSDVCHTTQFCRMFVTQLRILWYMSHHKVFSNVCHTAQNSQMYVTPPSFL